MKTEYKYYFKHIYDKDWKEVLKEDYEKSLTLKKLWKFMGFEAKKEKVK